MPVPKDIDNSDLIRLVRRSNMTRREIATILELPLNSSKGYSNSTLDHWLSERSQCQPYVTKLLRLVLELKNVL